MKSEKTNVMRLLDAAKIDYEAFEYDAEKYVSGVEVAKALSEDEDALFKTLVTYSEKAREYFVFCIPSAYERPEESCGGGRSKGYRDDKAEGAPAAYRLCAWRLLPDRDEETVQDNNR